MNQSDIEGPMRKSTAADWYLCAVDRDREGDGDGGPGYPDQALADRRSMHDEHADAVARCDAVMALTPRLRNSPDVGWAFEEAGRIARTVPVAAEPARGWYQRPGPAWATAALAAAAAVALAVLHWLPEPTPAADPNPTPAVTNITVAPIVVPASLDQIRQLADVEPVVRIANQLTVDGRSIVVLPFAANGIATGTASEIARTLYLDTVRQLAEIPGLYVIEPSTAAVWTGTEFAPEQIAAFLGVRGVLQGRVTTVDDEVMVAVRFTDAARDGLTLERAYERPVEEVTMIRNDITAGLLDAMSGPNPITY